MATPKTAPARDSNPVNLSDFKPASADAPAPTTALTATAAKLAKLHSGDYQPNFVKVMKMTPGKDVAGIFEGLGEYLWVEDPADSTKENRIATWKIRVDERMVVGIMSSSQLDNKLPNYPVGDIIIVQLLAEKGESKRGRRFSDFLISEPESGWLATPNCKVDAPQKRTKAE